MNETQANQMINLLVSIENKLNYIVKRLEDKKPKGK